MSLLGLLKNRRMRAIVFVFSLILTVLGLPHMTWGDDDAAPQADEVVPLQDLLARIREDFTGQVLEVEIEQEWRQGGRIWVYEAKILTPDGHVLKLEYDAKSLELLETRGRNQHHRSGGSED